MAHHIMHVFLEWKFLYFAMLILITESVSAYLDVQSYNIQSTKEATCYFQSVIYWFHKHAFVWSTEFSIVNKATIYIVILQMAYNIIWIIF